MPTYHKTSDKAHPLAREYTIEALRLVLHEVDCIKHRMKQLEQWQATMDMILKRM